MASGSFEALFSIFEARGVGAVTGGMAAGASVGVCFATVITCYGRRAWGRRRGRDSNELG
jgi:hypothetical protein